MVSERARIASGEWHPPGSSRSVPSQLVEVGGDIAALDEASANLAAAGFAQIEISQRVGSIPRRIEFPDGSLFETSDNDAIDRLLTAHGKVAHGLIHQLERYRPRLVLVVVATALSGGQFTAMPCPRWSRLRLW